MKGKKSPLQKKFFTDFFLHFFSPFKRLFAPTSQSQMSKLFRFSEFLEKKLKEVVSDLKTFTYKGCKMAQQKKSFLANFALLTLTGFFGIGATIRINREMLCLPYAGFFNTGLAVSRVNMYFVFKYRLSNIWLIWIVFAHHELYILLSSWYLNKVISFIAILCPYNCKKRLFKHKFTKFGLVALSAVWSA